MAGVGQRRSELWVLVKERDYMEDLGVDGRIISRGVLKGTRRRERILGYWLRTGK